MFSNVRNNFSQDNLVEFKAGRCKLEPGSGSSKRIVVAEKEKGLVFIKQSNDNLMHFCWKNRESGALVDDLIIFPGDTEFKEVRGCPNGQVFMLKFKSSEERRLFWLQDSSVEGDIVRKVNDMLNKPPPQRSTPARERNTTGGGLSNISASDTGFQDLGALGGLDQNQLMQLLQFMSPGTATSESTLSIPQSMSTPQNVSPSMTGSGEVPLEESLPEDNNTTPESAAPPNGNSATSPREPEPKRGKPDDDMELD